VVVRWHVRGQEARLVFLIVPFALSSFLSGCGEGSVSQSSSTAPSYQVTLSPPYLNSGSKNTHYSSPQNRCP
jgi:hypothetical protein